MEDSSYAAHRASDPQRLAAGCSCARVCDLRDASQVPNRVAACEDVSTVLRHYPTQRDLSVLRAALRTVRCDSGDRCYGLNLPRSEILASKSRALFQKPHGRSIILVAVSRVSTFLIYFGDSLCSRKIYISLLRRLQH